MKTIAIVLLVMGLISCSKQEGSFGLFETSETEVSLMNFNAHGYGGEDVRLSYYRRPSGAICGDSVASYAGKVSFLGGDTLTKSSTLCNPDPALVALEDATLAFYNPEVVRLNGVIHEYLESEPENWNAWTSSVSLWCRSEGATSEIGVDVVVHESGVTRISFFEGYQVSEDVLKVREQRNIVVSAFGGAYSGLGIALRPLGGEAYLLSIQTDEGLREIQMRCLN